MARTTLNQLAVLTLLLLPNGCSMFGVSEAELDAYHSSRWEAILAAEHGDTAVLLPGSPALPAEEYAEIEALYAALLNDIRVVQTKDAELLKQSELSIELCAEMIDALVSRNVGSVGKLAPNVEEYRLAQEGAQRAAQAAAASKAETLTALEDKWDALHRRNEFVFDLHAAAGEADRQTKEEVDELRREALEHYHNNEYNRLAETYLGYVPAVKPLPKSHIPQHCQDLAYSLRVLEAALLVRYSIDKAISGDVEIVQKYAAGSGGRIDWKELTLPRDPYSRGRVETAMARLKLLKILDSILSQAQPPISAEVARQWHLIWPAHSLETDIYRYVASDAGNAKPQDDELPLGEL